ncbi:hypothetical protein HDV00_010964 [Rhizophlyctis rosea]|nr:hypothetical protein HDV00_010964 [Rhizophlyctis rosea]
MPITDFKDGLPVEQVRALEESEKGWDFWTTSDAFSNWKPTAFGLTFVPPGEVWVIGTKDRVTKVLPEGTHFVTPFVEQVKCVKSPYPVVMGIIAHKATTQDGKKFDGYVVAHVKITDAATSAGYVDPETGREDSERAAANLLRKTFRRELSKLSLQGDKLSASESSALTDKLVSVLKSKSDEFGLEPINVEIRGAWPTSENVPARLRAMDPPPLPEDHSGHNLSNDYWADVLTPPYFEKKTFGSNKTVRTPATVSLEWVIPSPPDYHHFHELPRMIASRPEKEGKAAVKAAH